MPSLVSDALTARRDAKAAEQAAEQATEAAIATLLGDGYTVRDVGAMLGISPQRVSQIDRARDGRWARRAS